MVFSFSVVSQHNGNHVSGPSSSAHAVERHSAAERRCRSRSVPSRDVCLKCARPCASLQSRGMKDCRLRTASLYESALSLAREERFEDARMAFEAVVEACPIWQKPWVSYAQMEKRAATFSEPSGDRWNRCRLVLQRALTLNPAAFQVIQAWGLMELQRGNLLPAVRLLERCATGDPICAPVLRWKLVQDAKKTVGSRKKRLNRKENIIN